jgi:asparagine synthase (glutamine-hydrolysing)
VSGIYGVFRRDGAPLASEKLAAMQQAMAYWGPDGSQQWQSGPLGLGYLALHSTPEARFESQPLSNQENSLVLIASARLDNREDLCASLNIPAALMANTPDSALILKAYEKWGRACLNQLLGDWAFAIWDDHQQQLFVARDHNGVSGLYFYADPRFFAFASSIKSVLALKEVPRRLNKRRLAQLLVVYPDPEGDKFTQLYADISCLPPAHRLTVSRDHLDVEEYWRLEDTSKMQLGSDDEYVEAFLELYDQAVSCRIRSCHQVGLTLSGGLDSSSVLALAGRAAKANNQQLTAFTSIPLYDTQNTVHRARIGNEWSLAQATAEMLGNVDHQAVEARDISPLQGIQLFLELYEQASHAAANFYWMFAIYAQAQGQGLVVLLNGQRGNATISWNGGKFPIMTKFRSGDLRGGWKAMRAWKSAHQVSWAKAIKSQMLAPLQPYIDYFQSYLPLQSEPWGNYSAIHPGFARRLKILPHVRQAVRDSAAIKIGDPEIEHYASYHAGRMSVGSIWLESSAGYDLEIRDPTIDQRLLEFCFSIPVDQFRRAKEDRWLIRRAMQGLLPPQVLSNPLRGLQAADVAFRVLAHPDEMVSTLARLDASPIVGEYLNLPKMRQVWRSLQKSVNVDNTSQCGSILLRGILAGLFLLRFHGEQDVL